MHFFLQYFQIFLKPFLPFLTFFKPYKRAECYRYAGFFIDNSTKRQTDSLRWLFLPRLPRLEGPELTPAVVMKLDVEGKVRQPVVEGKVRQPVFWWQFNSN